MPRPRFSLATLFILLTAVGVWLGVRVKWIKDRREFQNRARILFFPNPFEDDAGFEPGYAPGLLWLFGEKTAFMVVTDAANAQEAHRLFPEAEILYDPPPHLIGPAELNVDPFPGDENSDRCQTRCQATESQ